MSDPKRKPALESPFLDEEIFRREPDSDASKELKDDETAFGEEEQAEGEDGEEEEYAAELDEQEFDVSEECEDELDSDDQESGSHELIDEEKGSGASGIRLGWQTKKNGEALSIGLELGGDAKKVSAPIPGRIRLLEVSGRGKSKGDTESAAERLVSTWHGTFHRNAKAPSDGRITFELFVSPHPGNRHQGQVLGFDPECLLGADALVMTFVNREFEIPFPFFVDSRSEGKALEFVAVAEIHEGRTWVELGRSDVLSVPIRRVHEVDTTTIVAGKPDRYKGALVGNQILHHEDYLLVAASHPTGSIPKQPRRVPISPTGVPGLTFQKYTSGSLRIVLLNDLLDDLVPSARELTQLLWVPKGVTSKLTPNWVRLAIRSGVSLRLNDLFLNAGFKGIAALWDTDKAAGPLVTQFKNSFAQRGRGALSRFWEIRDAKRPLQVPFWTFFVVFDNVNVGRLGLAESLQIDHRTTRGSVVFRLTSPVPIGSGNKGILAPIRIDTGKLTNHLTTQAEGAQRPGHSVREHEATRLVDLVAGQLANTIAHEVAHSLGLMHDVGLELKGPFTEQGGNSSVSIMASAAEESAPAGEAVFSDQAKVIWQSAFGVQPTFHPAPLRNKTWTGDEWKTVDWSERMERLRRRYAIDRLEIPSYVRTDFNLGRVPPFAKAAPKVQKGTHVP